MNEHEPSIVVSNLTVENCREPLGLWTGRPRFSWTTTSGRLDVVQAAYELELRRDPGDALVWASGRVASGESVLVPHAGPTLDSATGYGWRVRVEVDGRWSPWVESRFETSLLRRADWVAEFVEPIQAPVTPDGLARVRGQWQPRGAGGPPEERLHPAKYLRQEFRLRARPARARLYATAQGVYSAEINGGTVGDQVLAPGYESYDRQLSFQAYDVTALLDEGANAIGVVLADGWYAGRIDFSGTSAQYGDRLRAGWQLVVDHADGSREVIVSDARVRSATDGPIRYADIFIGECFDGRADLGRWTSPGFDDSRWSPVRVVPAPEALVPFLGEPVRRVMELPALEVLRTPAGDTVVDFRQVIAGRVRLRARGASGTTITLEHSETLDAAGNFFQNIVGVNKDQADRWILAGDPAGEEWEPTFTFHGFRYVRLTGYPGTPGVADVRAIVVASDLEPMGDFRCSDARVTRLHNNVVWSQRANFLAVPTDCPQRERVGWTGDIGIFAPAATRNAKVISFLRRWLGNVRLDQAPDGRIPVIVPAPPVMAALEHDLKDDPLLSRNAVAGWSDAIVTIPWVLFGRYGDRLVLEENYAAMRAWVERQIRVAESGIPARFAGRQLSEQERDRQRLLWNTEPNFGDWLAPSVAAADPSLEHMLAAADRTGEIVGTLYHAYSTELLHRIAAVLGIEEDEHRYGERAARTREAFAEEYLDTRGRLAVETQGTYVLALALGGVPPDRHAASVARLVELIHAAGDHLDTGFLSVPFLLEVLSANGLDGLARRLLWQPTPPSWLYEVDRGATTIWEDWYAVAPTGEVRPTSLNHFAFGCVDEWLYGRLAGIAATSPGYRTVRIEPDLRAGIEWVEAAQTTPYGDVRVRWERDPADPELITVSLETPPNTTCDLVLPAEAELLAKQRGGRPWNGALRGLGSGRVVVSVRLPASPHTAAG